MTENRADTEFNYAFVNAVARVALYDDLSAAPRITKIEPAETAAYIENLTTTVYEQSKLAGGKVPYVVIREVSENFIHAQFKEIVVSILDDGNTIRFADQGPGIAEKENAQKPGFSSAIEPMKGYIRGVGSGFPIVRDYLDNKDGSIVIEDNLTSGAVVTISLVKRTESQAPAQAAEAAAELSPAQMFPHVAMSEREKEFMRLLLHEGALGVTEIHDLTGYAPSTVHATLRKLEESSFVERAAGKKRSLTEIGAQVAQTL